MACLFLRRNLGFLIKSYRGSKFSLPVSASGNSSFYSVDLSCSSTEVDNVTETAKAQRNDVSVKQLLKHSLIKCEGDVVSDSLWASSAFPKLRDQSSKALRPKIDPRETCIVLFPGQGTQYVGMGRKVSDYGKARELCEVASDYLGYDLLKLCLEGPKDKLDRTEFSQLAVFVLSVAAIERLKSEYPIAVRRCVATAGFSVGEFAALVFAGSLSFIEALKLVKVRAEAMQAASDAVSSGMMTVFYGPDSELEKACLSARQWCLEYGIEDPECRIANYLFPHCKVIAGHSEALKYIQANASRFRLKRLKPLPVSGAFHTNLMKAAVDPFKKALRKAHIQKPSVPVHANVDATMYRDEHDIRQKLVKQMYKPVKWEQTLHVLYERASGQHFPQTYEIGPGTSLKSCLKMVNAKAWDSCVSVEV